MSRPLLFAGWVLALAACARLSPRRAPETVVILATAPVPAEQLQATATFDRWVETSIRTPGAAFRLLQAGRDRNDARTLFAARIPLSWGAPNAVANRAAYVVRQGQAFRTAITTLHAMSADAPADGATPIRVITMPPLDSRGRRWAWQDAGSLAHTVAICDVSPSDVGRACTADSLSYSYDAWLATGLAVGSTFQVWLVGTSIADATRVFTVQIPELPQAERIAFVLGARNELSRVFDRLPARAGSAVAEAIAVAVADLATKRGTKSLDVASDLRQTSAGWAFDRHVPAAPPFCRWLRAERLLPDCESVRIRICGVHFRSTPRHPPFDARSDHQLRAVWLQAFAAMHPASVEICSECDPAAFASLGGAQ